jgi:hypothetical protein
VENDELLLQVGAVQFVLFVLLASHHNKAELLATFDRMLSEHQVAALGGGGTGLPDEYRVVLEKYRDQIKQHMSR